MAQLRSEHGKACLAVQRPSDEDDLGDQGDHLEGDQMPPQAQAIELLCRCDDIPDDGVELRVLKGLLTAATSSATHLHGQVCILAVSAPCCNVARSAMALGEISSYIMCDYPLALP